MCTCVQMCDTMMIFRFATCVANKRPCVQFVRLWTDNKEGACGWSCQNHRTTGRKCSPTDGWRERRSGSGSIWERHKAFRPDWERECAISQVAKPRRPAKARPGRCWVRPPATLLGGHRVSRWGNGEGHSLAVTARGRLRLRVMGNAHAADGFLGDSLLRTIE